MKQPKNKQKNPLLRSKVYKILGMSSIGVTTLSGFVIYESLMDWSNFKQELDNFIIISQGDIKLNLAVALPLLISLVVFLAIFMRKNREYFKDKVSLAILLAIGVFYLVYSVVEVVLASLIGAFTGAVLDEFLFTPLSNANAKKANDDHDVELEARKETVRAKTRKEIAKQNAIEAEKLDGSA